MFATSDIHLLYVESVGWISILAIIRFDVDGKAYARIEVVIVIRRIVIDIELAVVAVLNGVGHNLSCRIIMWNHTPCPVDNGSGKR